MPSLIWLIPFLPLCAALWTGLGGERVRDKAGLIACTGIFSALMLTLGSWVAVAMANSAGGPPLLPFRLELFTWMEVGGVPIGMAFLVDQLSMIMLLVVTLLGSLIFFYARGYMEGDPGYARFFTYLSLFAFAMLILVLADNFLLMFVGWEGVGLCSYLLIGFYFKEGWCADAGRKAFIANRIGDFGFLLATFLIFGALGTLSFPAVIGAVEANPAVISTGLATAITFCLLLAATGKSAQIPLYVWLPDAMAGPTPVSALIHAATMVTAGIYMAARLNVLFVLAPVTMAVMAIVGAATALIAALIACTQTDIKKVLAYSTVSQLGYMFLALGVGAFGAAMFHVFTHAFFKGCLFLCAGSVIHALHHEQDMRNMGGLRRKMPVTAATYLLSTIAIAGIPPLSGFFSKDEILWNVIGQMSLGHTILWVVGAITALLTAFYMFRSYFMTFEGETRMDDKHWSHAHESPRSMTDPLIVLAFGAVVVGVLGLPPWLTHLLHLDHLTLLFANYLAPITEAGNNVLHHMGEHGWHPHFEDKGTQHMMEGLFALISVCIAFAGLGIAWMLYGKHSDTSVGDEKVQKVPGYKLASAKFYVDEVYEKTVLALVARGAKGAVESDKRSIDGFLVFIIEKLRGLGGVLRSFQTGSLQTYAAGIIGGLILFLILGLLT